MEDAGRLKQKPQPRCEPQDPATMPQAWQQILQRIPGDGLKGRYAPVNVLGTLMHSPDILGEFLDYWVTCKLKLTLSIREQELVILRMGVLYGSAYVWKHHVPVAIEFGIQKEELAALRASSLPAAFAKREQALLEFTDTMVIHRDIDETVWGKYRDVLTQRDVLDLIHLISQYVLFALTNNVMRVELEKPLQEIND